MARVVSIDQIEQFFGSGDERSLNRVAGWLRNEFPRMDDDLPDAPPAYQILHNLVMDPTYRQTQDTWPPDHEAKAIRLLELLTGWIGDPDLQPNRSWSAMNFGWFDAVDQALALAGSPARASDLTSPHSVADLPVPMDIPIIHVTSADDARRWVAETKDLDLSSTPGPEREAIEEMRGWMEETVKQAEAFPSSGGDSLITFYY